MNTTLVNVKIVSWRHKEQEDKVKEQGGRPLTPRTKKTKFKNGNRREGKGRRDGRNPKKDERVEAKGVEEINKRRDTK